MLFNIKTTSSSFNRNYCFDQMMLYKLYLIKIFLLWSSICLNGQYYLYDDDCLDFYAAESISQYSVTGEAYRKEHQIIPFCRRDDVEDEYVVVDNDIPSLTFDQLNKRNITSAQLYPWSTHLDFIEEYQAFREHQNDEKHKKFHNCSARQRFGLFCQYSFGLQVGFIFILSYRYEDQIINCKRMF
jgi:hypothetical protein